jgi:cell wall-associated NlpC family hydrolase
MAILSSIVLLFTQCKTSGSAAKTPASSGSREARLRKDIVHYAGQFKGAPYQYAGKNPRSGFDCSGFTSYVMDNFDIALSPASREQAKQGKVKPLHDAQPGDLVFFRRSSSEPVFHVALIVEADRNSMKVIHSTTSRGVIVEDILSSSYWKPKIYQVRDVVR